MLEAYAGKSRYPNHGERVVTGQRMLQAASDVFLGWTRADDGHDYYFRQLRDMKMKFDLESMSKSEWLEYVQMCGWTLARAHARTGDAARIAGYLGKNAPSLTTLSANLRVTYADQTEKDHANAAESDALRDACVPQKRRRNNSQIQRQGIFAGDQPRGAVEGEIQPGPLQHHQQTILKLHDVEQVHEDPHQPSRPA